MHGRVHGSMHEVASISQLFIKSGGEGALRKIPACHTRQETLRKDAPSNLVPPFPILAPASQALSKLKFYDIAERAICVGLKAAVSGPRGGGGGGAVE